MPVCAAVGVELGDHCWPEDATRVVEHVDYSERDRRCEEVSAVRRGENVGWGDWMLQLAKLWGEMLPACKEDDEDEADG